MRGPPANAAGAKASAASTKRRRRRIFISFTVRSECIAGLKRVLVDGTDQHARAAGERRRGEGERSEHEEEEAEDLHLFHSEIGGHRWTEARPGRRHRPACAGRRRTPPGRRRAQRARRGGGGGSSSLSQ